MTTMKAPATVESPPTLRTRRQEGAPSQQPLTEALAEGLPEAAAVTSEELNNLLLDCIGDGTGRVQRYIEFRVGGIDEPNLEPALYQLLGVSDSIDLLFGVQQSTVSTRSPPALGPDDETTPCWPWPATPGCASPRSLP